MTPRRRPIVAAVALLVGLACAGLWPLSYYPTYQVAISPHATIDISLGICDGSACVYFEYSRQNVGDPCIGLEWDTDAFTGAASWLGFKWEHMRRPIEGFTVVGLPLWLLSLACAGVAWWARFRRPRRLVGFEPIAPQLRQD